MAQADAYQLPLNITDKDMMALVEQAGELFVPLACLEVADDKDGIAAEHLHNIFVCFYHVYPCRSRVIVDSRSGLTITEAIAEVCDGRITT